jgi:hypothetical protein
MIAKFAVFILPSPLEVQEGGKVVVFQKESGVPLKLNNPTWNRRYMNREKLLR